MDKNSAAFFEAVEIELAKMEPALQACLDGQPICIVVKAGGFDLYFGTANETWGADIYANDDYTDECVETDKLISDTDMAANAQIIYDAAQKFIREH